LLVPSQRDGKEHSAWVAKFAVQRSLMAIYQRLMAYSGLDTPDRNASSID
jgi:hypothetical protein